MTVRKIGLDNISEYVLSASLTAFLSAMAAISLFQWLGASIAFMLCLVAITACAAGAIFFQYRAYRGSLDKGRSEQGTATSTDKELSEGIEKYSSDSSYRFQVDDLDELKWQKRELNFIFEEASSATRLKQELVRNVAHEIKTPLTSLQIVAEGLEDGVFTVDDGTSIAQITESVSRLNATVKMMSAYVSNGADALVGETSDLAACLVAAYERACETARKHDGVKVSLRKTESVDGAVMLVNMSAAALDAVLSSVVSNAFEHAHGMQNLVISLEDEVHPVTRRHMAKVSIADDGCGAPSNVAYRMCEPFWKADESHTLDRDKVSSPGLGLSIVREIVSGTGGDMDIQCSEGAGTCVSIWLPVSA